MRAVLIAPFLLPVRPDLSMLLQSPGALCEALAVGGLPGWEVLTDDTPSSAALIHEHEPIGATLAPRRLLSARALPAAHPALQHKGVTTAELSIGVHGAGCLVLWCSAPLGTLAQIEHAACDAVADVAGAVVAAFSAQSAAMVDRSSDGRYPLGELLWWHRVLQPSGPRETAAAQALLVGAVSRDVGQGLSLSIGDGWSVLRGGQQSDLAAVVRGISDAEEIWTTSESESRDVVLQMAAVQSAGESDPRAQLRHREQAVRVAEGVQLRAAVLQDQVRYTTGLRRTALDLAAEAWELSLVLAPVVGHLESLQVMLQRRIEERREVHASHTQAALFALAVLTAFGLVLAVFETAFGLPLERHPARLLTAAAVILIGGAAAAAAWALDRRRSN
ncbi:MAG: hypothetical protein JWM40_1170 [Frankiales bacterium]|nr:hypothetical protein [Frankiales bacterium]